MIKKTKNIGNKIILTAFIVLICFPWLFWIFLEKYVVSTNYENRNPAERPKLTLDNYGTYPKEYDAYFNDNIPFRNNLIIINNAIDYFIFNRSTSDNVIIGKDNWLFYSKESDGDPIGCYQGNNLLSKDELSAIAKNCINQRDFLKSQGKEFVIFIAPNKERVNYEYMPERYGTPKESYRALQVVEYLRHNTDLRVVYPYDELMQAKESIDENIYRKTDTHWNYIGAYIGAKALMAELGIDMPAINSKEITITKGNNVSGDLAGMLNLTKQLSFADVEYTVSGYNTHNMKTIEIDFNNAFIYHSEGADPRKIYVLRDSFSTHMAPYIGSQFNDSYLRHKNSYSYDDFKNQNPDIFVYETVERYIGELENFSIQ